MALKPVFVAALYFFAFCGAQQNCDETQCKLLLLDENAAAYFRAKSSEKGVRMVYLNLEIGNDSYHPLELKDEFLPERWSWANTIGEPMLSLSYDYDILSLGLLDYQVRSLSVPLEEQPSGCLARLNSSCQNVIVGKALLHDVTNQSGELARETSPGVVCVAMILQNISLYEFLFEGNVKYNCCQAEGSLINCKLAPTGEWLKAVYYVLNILTIVMVLYSAAFPLALPDWIFSFEEECKRQNLPQRSNGQESFPFVETGRSESDGEYTSLNETEENEIPLDDYSPVTCSSLLRELSKELPVLPLSFNIKLMVFLLCIIPFFFYIDIALNFKMKIKFVDEADNIRVALMGFIFSFIFWMKNCVFRVFFVIAFVVIPLVTIMFMRPTSLKVAPLSSGYESSRDTCNCCFCGKWPSYVGDHMLDHLKILQLKVYAMIYGVICINSCLFECFVYSKSCSFQSMTCCQMVKRAFYFLYVIFVIAVFVLFIVPFSLVLFLFFSVVLLFFYSPFVSLSFDVVITIVGRNLYSAVLDRYYLPKHVQGCCSIIYVIVHGLVGSIVMILIPFYLFVYVLGACFIASLSCRFVVRLFGFLIMGLVLNAQIVSPFVTFFIVATTNIYLCYNNLQNKYKEVKELISRQWQEHKDFMPPDTVLSRGNDKTIPKDLFWFVCGSFGDLDFGKKVLPVGIEVVRMVRNMTLILIFLFLTLSAVVFFQNTFDISAVASSVVMVITGSILGFFVRGLTVGDKFRGWNKICLEERMREAVIEYIKRKYEPNLEISSSEREGFVCDCCMNFGNYKDCCQ